ncbi:MAG: ABC transporter permease [Chitinophagaceae bacterium]
MYKLFQVELYKIFRRPRTYLSFAGIGIFIVIIQLGLKVDGKELIEFVLGDLSNSFQFDGKMLNGYFVCYVLLQSLLVHVPLLIALIAGDMISGEAGMGTLRLLLSKPISRTQFVLAKFFAAMIYTLLLLVWVAFLSLFVSMFIFGTDDMILLKNTHLVQIAENDIFWRYICAFFFAAIAMTTVAALAFFLSQFSENSLGPIVATMLIIIILTIFSTMSIPIFNKIKPYMFTTHMVAWKEFFDVKVDENNVNIAGSIARPEKITNSVIVLIIHIIGFVSLSVYTLRKKDILS